VRVLVKGASTAVLTSWMGGPRTDLAYPRVCEAELLRAGQPAQVRVTAAVGAQARHARRSWEHEVITWSPDVVVLHYGQYEAVHLFIPWLLERRSRNLSRPTGAVRDTVHRLVTRKAYMGLARVQQRVDGRVPAGAADWRFRRMGADLEALIRRIRNIASPLVLVADQLHPGPNWARAFPGMARRVDRMNAMFAELVARVGEPDVRLFRISEIVGAMALDDPSPDGGHFSPEVHREVGRALASVILDWTAALSRSEMAIRHHGPMSLSATPS
jgi:hypothetical protein